MMMGGQSSKKKKDNESSSPPLRPDNDSEFSAVLNSYAVACEQDPELETFDSTLHQRTSRVINSLATGVEVRSVSIDSLREVTECLLEMNQDVVKVILECKEDIWNNGDLFGLVNLYFESSVNTLDFCTALENSLKRAKRSQMIIRFAINQFEVETESESGVSENKYLKTLEELKKFRDAGDPFTEEFFILFDAVHTQQKSMLQKLQKQKRKLDKKLKSLKTWRKVSNVVFVTAFVSVLIFSVVAAAVAAPPVVTALAGALAVPVGSVGKWCNYLWKRYEKAVRGQKEIVTSIKIGTYITVRDLENIRVLVNRLEVEIESLLKKAEFALTEEEVVKIAMGEIKKKMDVFTETVEELGQHAAKYCTDVTKARTVILQRIIRYPTRSTTEEAAWTDMVS